MKKLTTMFAVIFLGLAMAGTASADVIHEEHVTDGTLDLIWTGSYGGDFLAPDTLTAEDPCHPNPSGDTFVGKVNGIFAGPHALGAVLAGDTTLCDYRLDAWVCVGAGNAKRGILFRWHKDTAMGYQLILDAGMFTLMFRYGDGGMSPLVLDSWSGGDIPGGIPAAYSWHKFSIEGSGNQFNLYWDDVLLDGCPITHSGMACGPFGLYLFSAEPTDIHLVADDIVASGLEPVAVQATTWGRLKSMYSK
jgi:hypothetical protein